MNSKEFNYDVAFSFTQQDEELAYTLYNLLNDRLKCFIYSEEQKKLAGGDGESLFNSIFSVESRIVVILFRTEYGITKWTRIEETAIRNRGYDEGYDFVILIPTENQVNPPKWLPKNRLWIGLNRWGIEAAAGVIEARVQEFGGVVKIESIADKTARAEMELNEKKKREDLLNSTQAIFLAREEIENLKKIFRTHVEDILQKTQNWHIKLRENRHDGIDVLSYGYILYFHFYQQWANTLHDTYLFVAIFKGYFDENGNVTDPFSENI
ncbi:MAG: hypothetical protein EPN92_07585, partial [Chitinophagaceae bacterium]